MRSVIRKASSSCNIGNRGKPFLALFYSKSMKPPRRKPQSKYGKNQRFDDEHDILAMMEFSELVSRSPPPSIILVNKILLTFREWKRFSVAIRMYKEMIEKKFVPDYYSINNTIACCCESKQIGLAYSVFAHVFLFGTKPHISTFNALMNGLIVQNRTADDVSSIYTKIAFYNCEPDVVTYNTRIKGFCAEGDTVSAIQMLRLMKKKDCAPTKVTYGTILNALSKAMQIGEAASIFAQMIKNGIPPDTIAFNSLISGTCGAGDLNGAKKWFDEMVREGICPNVTTYSSLVNGFCKTGFVDKAEIIIDTMIQRGVQPNVVTYNTLMDGYCLRGQMDKAREVFDLMGSSVNTRSFNILIKGYCKCEKISEAYTVFQDMPRQNIAADTVTYSTIMGGFIRGGKIHSAKKLFSRMQQFRVVPDIQCYSILMDGLCSSHQLHSAIQLFKEMNKKLKPDVVIITILLEGLCKAGQIGKAKALFSAMLSSKLHPNIRTYSVMLKGLCDHALLDEAETILGNMKEHGRGTSPIGYTYNLIVRGFLKIGEISKALAYIEEMRINGFVVDSSTAKLIFDFLSFVRRKQDVGGGGGPQHHQKPVNRDVEVNDAAELFNRSRGVYPLCTKLELSLSATNLRDRDITSKSDPVVVVYVKKGDGELQELGRTEVILNCLNPVWIEKVTISYHFETLQPLIFDVYDVDTKHHNAKTLNLKDQQFLGEGSCVLSEIVTKQSRSLTVNLRDKSGREGLRNLGTLTVHAEETLASKRVVEIKFRCSQLENKDLFSKSDPFLRISRIVESGGSVPICKTEVVDNNLNPSWKPLFLSMQQFGSKDNPLVIECFDFYSNGNHVLNGKLQKSVADLERLYKEKTSVNFVIPSSPLGHEKVAKGQLFVDQFCEKEQFSFLDYISSGFELNFMVAVDFAASNGNPHQHHSWHYIDPYGRLNSYQQAITEVGEVIQFYDADKRFPAWGFGGKTAGRPVSHCFNLDGTATGFEVEGIQGIMNAYTTAQHNVTLAGPTLFGQVLNKAAEIAGNSLFHNNNKYYVLLIITDGILADLPETKDALVRASDLPLSVLIVGVGNGDFKQMEILDAGNERLSSSTGHVATRDIVQFVPMREVQSGRISAGQLLLKELPGQFLSYMRCRDFKPLTFSAVDCATILKQQPKSH